MAYQRKSESGEEFALSWTFSSDRVEMDSESEFRDAYKWTRKLQKAGFRVIDDPWKPIGPTDESKVTLPSPVRDVRRSP